MNAIRIATCLLALSTLSGCDSNERELSWDEARIQSRGVDGVTFGMISSEVTAIIGSPDGLAYADGHGKEYIGFLYNNGNHEGIAVYFLVDKSINKDEYQAISIHLSSNYKGKDVASLGIGSNIKGIINYYGDPDLVHGIVDTIYTYCTKDGDISFNFDPPNKDHVSDIWITNDDPSRYDGLSCM